MVSQCNKHIAEQVLLRWSVNSCDDLPHRWGIAKLHGLTLCPQMLDIVCTSPIYWGNINKYLFIVFYFIFNYTLY